MFSEAKLEILMDYLLQKYTKENEVFVKTQLYPWLISPSTSYCLQIRTTFTVSVLVEEGGGRIQLKIAGGQPLLT